MTSLRARYLRDRLMAGLVVLGTALVVIPLVLVMAHVIREGSGAINVDFFVHLPKPVGEPGGGLVNSIVGTLVVNLLAALIGVTFGVGAGVYLAEYREERLVPVVRLVSDVLGGMPAIVMGLVAYVLVVVPMGHFSALAGAVALGPLMIPIVARATEGVLRLVPVEQREAALALGLPRWRVILSVVLPAARSGIITGVLLALARVAGEAAPLLFTAFGNPYLTLNPLQPMDTLPLRLFAYAISPYREWHQLAWAAALVLVVLILIATVLARWAVRRRVA